MALADFFPELVADKPANPRRRNIAPDAAAATAAVVRRRRWSAVTRAIASLRWDVPRLRRNVAYAVAGYVRPAREDPTKQTDDAADDHEPENDPQ